MAPRKKLIAFNGDEKLKKQVVAIVLAHQKADEVEQGTYGSVWDDFDGVSRWRGCAVGCTIRAINKIYSKKRYTDNHKNYEEIGIPKVLAEIEDGIFEGLSTGEAKTWPVKFLKAIPVGADLSKVVGAYRAMVKEYEQTYEYRSRGYNENYLDKSKLLLQLLRKAPVATPPAKKTKPAPKKKK